MLAEHNINVVLLNKQDSSYNMFGEIELFVSENQQDNAIALLKEIEDERNI